LDKTLFKGIRILEALAKSERPLGITEISTELGLTPSNVHRLLQTLTSLGYVRKRGGSGRYELSLRLWEIGSLVYARLDVMRVAVPHLRALAEATKETINLSILDGAEVVYIYKIDSPQPVRAHSKVGGRAPAHCSSTGKAMLAFQPESWMDRIPVPIRRMSDSKAISRRALDLELAEVRRSGYAMNLGEITRSIQGVAAPIFASGGQVVAAVGVAGPAERMRRETLIRHSPLVKAAALGVSESLGYSPSGHAPRFQIETGPGSLGTGFRTRRGSGR
jgi:IclR family transcriptional regulator, KDG regulon repressor